jgi:hypothetical protein
MRMIAVPISVRRQPVGVGARAKLAARAVAGDAISGVTPVWHRVEGTQIALLLSRVQRLEQRRRCARQHGHRLLYAPYPAADTYGKILQAISARGDFLSRAG